MKQKIYPFTKQHKFSTKPEINNLIYTYVGYFMASNLLNINFKKHYLTSRW